MKLRLNLLRTAGTLLGVWLCCVPLQATPDRPEIRSVHLDRNVVLVTAQVPAGLRKVVLESRLRFGAGTWTPRAVARLDGGGGEVSFRLPMSEQLEVLRVRAEETEPLPRSFYQGATNFTAQPASSSSYGNWAFLRGDLDAGAPETPSPSREVVESDIWKLQGQRLYFFNQYRGLQIIDISRPDQARILSTLSLPAAGEQMYLLGDRHAVLLVRDDCTWRATGPESAVAIVALDDVAPRLAARIPVSGTLQESRLVGTALYVASQTYRTLDSNNWEWGTLVSSFDLADPAAPIARAQRWYAGYGHTVAATPEFLFVITATPDNSQRSLIRCLDITAPDGQLADVATLKPFGHVADKFKLDWSEGILRVVSESSDASGTGALRWLTWLETFRLPHPGTAGPAGVEKLGEVSLGAGERLFATRFDGIRAYAVTYRQVDPLWMLDLADPTQPRVAGELRVPGWSTYIQPLGPRLVSLGIDDVDGRRVAVSLFDVADPAKPALLERVTLGEGYSWSAANQDEKGFSLLADQKLIVVPYQGSVSNLWSPRVQLIDLDLAADRLALRGEVLTHSEARRTAWQADRLLALSGTELLTIDTADRDHPVVRQTLPLIWSVDRVLVQGEWLVEVGDAAVSLPAPTLRIAPVGAPDDPRLTVSLPQEWPVAAATIRDSILYIAQTVTDWTVVVPENPDQPSQAVTRMHLSLFDLRRLPEALPALGEAQITVVGDYGFSNLQALWPTPGTLVLAGGDGFWGWPWWGGIGVPIGVPFRWPGWGGFGGGANRFVAFDVSVSAKPAWLSTLDLTATNRFSFSPAFAAEGLVLVSHAEQQVAAPVTWFDAAKNQWITLQPPKDLWLQQHYLDVIDYTDPRDPVIRKPVSLPGRLEGLAQAGALLYSIGPQWKPDPNWTYDGVEYVAASAYDGVAVHQVAALPLPTLWPHPLQIHEGTVFLGRAAEGTNTPPTLEAWGVADRGEFQRLSQRTLSAPAEVLVGLDGLLACQAAREVRLFDADPAQGLAEVGGGSFTGCVWFDLGSAAADRARGLWVPLGFYGVGYVPIAPTR